MSAILNRWLPGATLLAWSTVMLYFHLSGRLSDFLVPMFRPFVLAAGLVLLLMAAGMLISRAEIADCCEEETCSHTVMRSVSGRVLTFAVLILPIGAAAAFSPDGFGLNAILNRGVVTDASGLQPRSRAAAPPRSIEPALPTADGAGQDGGALGSTLDYLPRTAEGHVVAEVIDFLYAAEEADLRKDFEGQTVSVIGQLMPETANNPGGDRFRLVRMFMNCCAADARPVGVTVASESAPGLPEMSWVRVTAKAEFPVIGGRNVAVLRAMKVEKASPPDEAMLF